MCSRILRQGVALTRRCAELEHALAVLAGSAPSQLTLPRQPLAFRPLAIPAGLPSQLLERRPDIAAAERAMAAANARIGRAGRRGRRRAARRRPVRHPLPRRLRQLPGSDRRRTAAAGHPAHRHADRARARAGHGGADPGARRRLGRADRKPRAARRSLNRPAARSRHGPAGRRHGVRPRRRSIRPAADRPEDGTSPRRSSRTRRLPAAR